MKIYSGSMKLGELAFSSISDTTKFSSSYISGKLAEGRLLKVFDLCSNLTRSCGAPIWTA